MCGAETEKGDLKGEKKEGKELKSSKRAWEEKTREKSVRGKQKRKWGRRKKDGSEGKYEMEKQGTMLERT